MKRKLKSLLFSFVALSALTIMTFFMSCSKNNEKQLSDEITNEDVEYVASCLEKLSNPEFNSPESFMLWAAHQHNTYQQDSIIRSLPHETLMRIADVVQNKYNKITPQLIMEEYRESYNKVYQYMGRSVKSDTIFIDSINNKQQ